MKRKFSEKQATLMKANDAKFGGSLLLPQPNITGTHTSRER